MYPHKSFPFILLHLISLSRSDCPADTFPCGNGDCIDNRFVCDSVVDCKRILGEIDGRDEMECENDDNSCSINAHLHRLPEIALFRLTDSGYNIVKGGFGTKRIFQSERYDGECRKIEKVLHDGKIVNYRLPYNLLNWTYFNDKNYSKKPEFRVDVYENAHDAYKAMKHGRGVLSVNSSTTYTDMYLHLRGQFDGDSLYDSLQSNIRLLEEGYPFVRVYTEIITGTYRMKPHHQLLLHRTLFSPDLQHAVNSLRNLNLAEERFFNIFQRYGTHYVSGGKFGGVYQIHIYRGDCKRDYVKKLGLDSIGQCAHALLKRAYQNPKSIPTWNIPECTNATNILSPKLGPRRYDLLTTSHVSGGDPHLEKGLETAAVLLDLPNALPKTDFISWIRSLSHFPAPVDIQLVPVCDLITNSLTPAFNRAKLICQESLMKYLRQCNEESNLKDGCRMDYRSGTSMITKYTTKHCPMSLIQSCISNKVSHESCPYVVNFAIGKNAHCGMYFFMYLAFLLMLSRC